MTEATLDGSVVTLTLSGRTYERSSFKIRDAVSISGIDGATIPWHQPDRKSDTQITVELEFDGNINADSILTFTVGVGAIAGYKGPRTHRTNNRYSYQRKRAIGKLPESVQPGDVDTVSTHQTRQCHAHYLCYRWTSGSGLSTRTSTRRYVSKSKPRCLLGWQKCIRGTCGEWCLFLHTHNRQLHCYTKDVDTKVVFHNQTDTEESNEN